MSSISKSDAPAQAAPLHINQFTSIGRTLDLTYPTNLAIIVLTTLAGVVNGAISLFSAGDLGQAMLAGFYTGAAVFIAWVLARELDIDHEYAAFGAAGLAYAGTLIWQAPPLEIVALAALVIYARMLNRVVGLPFRWIDTGLALLLVILLALMGNWVMVLGLALALLLDGLLVDPLRRHILLALVAALAGGFVFVTMRGTAGILTTPYLMGAALVVLAFVVTIAVTRRIATPADMPQYTISVLRVRALMTLCLAIAIVTAVWGGDNGVRAMLPLWGVLAGVPLYRLYTGLQQGI